MLHLFGYVKSPICDSLFYKRFCGEIILWGFNGSTLIRAKHTQLSPEHSVTTFSSYSRYDLLSGFRITAIDKEVQQLIPWSTHHKNTSILPDYTEATAYDLFDPTKSLPGTELLLDTLSATTDLLKAAFAPAVNIIERHITFLTT